MGNTAASIGVIIGTMLICCATWKSLLKEEWQEFKEKVKLKMKEDKLKQ